MQRLGFDEAAAGAAAQGLYHASFDVRGLAYSARMSMSQTLVDRLMEAHASLRWESYDPKGGSVRVSHIDGFSRAYAEGAIITHESRCHLQAMVSKSARMDDDVSPNDRSMGTNPCECTIGILKKNYGQAPHKRDIVHGAIRIIEQTRLELMEASKRRFAWFRTARGVYGRKERARDFRGCRCEPRCVRSIVTADGNLRLCDAISPTCPFVKLTTRHTNVLRNRIVRTEKTGASTAAPSIRRSQHVHAAPMQLPEVAAAAALGAALPAALSSNVLATPTKPHT